MRIYDLFNETTDVSPSRQNIKPVITDSSGNPIVFYHGSPVDDIESFDHGHTAYGIFFTPDRSTAEYYARGKTPCIYSVHLLASNIADLDDTLVFERVMREAIDYSSRRDDELAREFAVRLYNEGYHKNAAVKSFFDSLPGIEDVGDDYSIADLLSDERIDYSEIDDLVQSIGSDKIAEAYNNHAPEYSEELQYARDAYGSQNFYMYYQNDFMRAAENMGYDSVVFADPSSTGDSVSYVVFDSDQIQIINKECQGNGKK